MPLPADVFERFDEWMNDAIATEPDVPDAMQLATVGPDGRPTLRTVLLKAWSEDGLLFYTNYTSRKAQQLDAAGVTSVLLHWKSRERQLIVEGRVERATAAESDAYFASRPRGSQIGAWASLQSQSLPDRQTLVQRVEAIEDEYEGQDVPRPPHWGGYRLVPDRVEFWQGMPSRLHVRDVHCVGDDGWTHEMVYP